MGLKVDNMLNIGTIVRIRGSVPLIMIIGYSHVKNNVLYDYIGCLYPVGILDTSSCLVFNSDDIKEVIENGYSNGLELKPKEEYINSLNQMDNIKELEKNQKEFSKLKDKLPEIFKVSRLLPVGAVVKIKDDNKNKYMITANLMENDKNEMFEYTALLYPVGIVGDNSHLFFNDDDITDIYDFGYSIDEQYIKNIINQNVFSGKNIHIE